MIDPYEFIDSKPGSGGLKERVLGPTIYLYNKLSADETNNIRAKLNEIADRVNDLAPPLFPLFALKFKGEGNANTDLLEVGDIVHGFYDASTIWDNAVYNGGDPLDKANYTHIGGKVPKIQFVADGVTAVYDIEDLSIITAVFREGALLDDADWEQIGTTFTLTFVPALGERIKPI